VFESYVTSKLRQCGMFDRFKSQSSEKYLASEIYNDNKRSSIFQIRPDIIAETGDAFYIMDAKWKIINGNDRLNKYGVSQSDMYQLLSYGKIYETEYDRVIMFLIYPENEGFKKEIYFRFNDKTEDGIPLVLWPFNIERSINDINYCREFIESSLKAVHGQNVKN
jgi:5-methylcytosine-specific restriction enzyme subunit McrC